MQGCGSFTLDQPQAFGIITHDEALARCRCSAVGHENTGDFCILGQLTGGLGNRAREIMGDGKAARGQSDRWLDNIRKGQLAISRLHIAPARQIAGNGNRGCTDDVASPLGVHVTRRFI